MRENKLTQAEWGAAIDALTRAMKFTDDKRNEYILFSDLLGVSSLVDMVNAAKSGTPSSVLGPFHIEGAPELANGGDLWKGQVGEPLVVSGRIADAQGAPAKGTVLALWQNSGNGLYAQQDARPEPDQLSRAAHGGRRRHLRLLDRAAGLLHRAGRRPGRRHAARARPARLAAGPSAHDHPGAGPRRR